MWGIPGLRVRYLMRLRSIPAYAGDPFQTGVDELTAKVYPRLRGGSCWATAGWRYSLGLSPPTRGIQYEFHHHHHPRRSIPAYAGDPRSSFTTAPARRVYPRLRGGSCRSPALSQPFSGLSPPTRGIHRKRRLANVRGGSIPAYAGDPLAEYPDEVPRVVYPRLRGGSADPARAVRRNRGLSPPTRGIPILRRAL